MHHKMTTGGEVTLINGLITDCGAKMQSEAKTHGWFPLSTLKEPYRIEGKRSFLDADSNKYSVI